MKNALKILKTYGGDGIAVAAAAKREDEFNMAGDTETTATAKPVIIVDKLDSVKSAIQHRDGKTAVLNFASYEKPRRQVYGRLFRTGGMPVSCIHTL